MNCRLIELPVEAGSVDRLWRWLDGWARRLEMDQDLVLTMRLCAEEAATNIIRHAFVDAAGNHTFRVALATDGDVTLTFEDEGMPFDPTAYVDPVPPTRLEDAAAGGVGIRLIRGSARSVRYRRVGNTNRLMLSFAVPVSSPDPAR